jgi:molecular chaperone DnaK
MPQIEVTFDIDANGIVNVSAKDKATGKEQQIRIQASGGLSDDDIENMVKDAEAHADEDKKRRELAEAHNQAEAMIHATEKTLKDVGDKVSDTDRKAVEDDLEALRGVKDSEDAAEIKAKIEALGQSSMKLGEAVYKAQADAEAAAGDSGDGGSSDSGSAESGGDDNVVDADFEEVDDDKKNTA